MENLLKYAIIGIETEIRKREAVIYKGGQLLLKNDSAEIREVISQVQKEIEYLNDKKFDYEWELSHSK